MTIKSLSIVAAAALALSAGAAQAQVSGLANAGFEDAANSAGEFADGWQGNQFAPTRTMDEAHSGSWSAMLALPINPFGGGGSGLFQNSMDHGGLLAVNPVNWGTAPTLSFWVKGNTSHTGNLNYALRYLDAGGAILNPPGSAAAMTIWTGNTDRPWTQITRTPDTVIPANTAAVFFEMTLAAGETGSFPGCGDVCNWGEAKVFLDDVNITLAVPEPGTYAMLLAGLGVVGFMARRRRAA